MKELKIGILTLYPPNENDEIHIKTDRDYFLRHNFSGDLYIKADILIKWIKELEKEKYEKTF